MRKIIVINGYPKTGKDTFVLLFDKIFDVTVYEYDTSEKYKRILRKDFEWSGKKSDKWRKAISDLKKFDIELRDGPFDDFVNFSRSLLNDCIVFVHCREPEEIKKLQDEFGAKTLLIKRPNTQPADNSSDMSVNMTKYDFVIENDGTLEDFEKKAIEFYEMLKVIE